MAAERRLEGVAVEVGAEHQDAGFAAPVPLVLPIARPLLVRGTAPGLRFGDLPARLDDRVTLLLGNLGIRGFAMAGPGEDRQARGPAKPSGKLVAGGGLTFGREVGAGPGSHPG